MGSQILSVRDMVDLSKTLHHLIVAGLLVLSLLRNDASSPICLGHLAEKRMLHSP